MPVVRRERHRSNSSSPKLLPSRTLSPRNAAAATGHRFLQLHHHSHHHHSGSGGFTATASSSGMGGSTGGSEPAKLASSSSSSSSSSVRAEIYAPLPPPILTTRNNNNNPSASTSSSPDSSSSNGSPSSSSMLFSQSSSSSHPSLGMSLRNHTRNILSEQQQQQRSAREDLMPPGGGAGRRLRGVDFRDMDYASSSNSDLTTTRGAAAGTARQMYPSQSSATSSSSSSSASSASSSGNNNHLHSHQAGLPASSRSDPCIRLLADVPDDFAEEKGSRRKRRRLMDMIDTNVPSNHPGMSLYEFIGPDFVDHFSAPLPPVNSSSHVGVAMSSASTSSSLGAHNRAPSRLSSSSSSSDGTNGGPSSGNHRVRRLSSRRKRVADLQNPPIYNVNGHLVQMQPHHHPGVPYPPGVAFGHAFCQAHALGHACSANHVHMNAATGSISAVPHLCCNVAMCPMQQQRATGHAGSVVGGAGYPGMGYASSGQQQQQQQQQQQIHPNSSQSTRHSQQQQQSMNQSMPSSQPHRTSQPYLPSDMLPGSHPYRTTPASYSQMIAASMQQQQDQQTNAHRLSHSHSTGSLPSSQQQHVLSGSSSAAAAAVRQQYSRHPGQASSESMAMYGAALSEMAAVAAGGGGPTWVSRRRMTENVTPATHLSQQNAAAGVRINSGVPFMTYDSGYFHHFQLARANQNSMSVGGPGYPYGAGQMDMSGHPHEHEQYELMLNIADRLNCESKPKGLTKQEIEKIRLRRFSGEKTDHGQTACVICICDFEPKQSLRQLPCTHEFHAKCVDKWLKSNRSCPICRGDASVYMKKSKLH